MRTYSAVSPQFWTGDTGKQLRKAGADAQVIALYLITSPHAHMSGVYYLPKQLINYETGRSEKAVDKVLKKLAELEFAFYDDKSEHIWVREMLAWQVKDAKNGDHRITGIVKWVNSLPSVSFFAGFYARYADLLPGLVAPSKPLRSPLNGALEGQQEGLPSPSSLVLVPDPALSEEGGVGETKPHGEHGHASLTSDEFEKLGQKLGELREDYIQQFDNWVHQAPRAKHNGVMRKDRNPYASICQWYDRAVKEGKVKSRASPSRPSEEEIERHRLAMFGERKRP